MTEIIPHCVAFGDARYWEWNENNKADKRKESTIQQECYLWAEHWFPDLMIFHPVNEGAIPAQYRDKLLKSGMVPGVSDLVVLKVSGDHPFACFELKRSTKTMAAAFTKEQKDWLRRCDKEGGYAAVCYGAKAFKQALCHYLGFTLYPDGYTVCRP